MSGMIDTNILLYAANRDAPEQPAAHRFLMEAGTSSDTWYFTEGIFYEFLRVSTHHKVFDRPLTAVEAIKFLGAFLSSPRFRILKAGARHWDILLEVSGNIHHAAGNLFFDLRTAALMLEHGVRKIYTLDADFLQFKSLQVINPLI